ncbi:hypothetical protein [Pseudofrankia asymbiotica]|uniref:Uncharacterized protein n=1 Tax=Pseudofrankia asymbiotica TaxID=1834516 RepID=A0A1V2I4N9_9ACTN|nr:hypothetical protein [Pseudofrankia asymbiotica]ONH25857.1 hypothetical protein BL253_26375 [Pseudofrankia asymbiotica]
MSDAVAFNTGLPLAARLREHVLRQLGAEDEWIGQGPGGTGLVWRHSELGTLLELLPVPGGASSVAVLRVTTPVATVDDLARAAALCRRRNGESTLNRWLVGPWPAIPYRDEPDDDEDDDGDEADGPGGGISLRAVFHGDEPIGQAPPLGAVPPHLVAVAGQDEVDQASVPGAPEAPADDPPADDGAEPGPGPGDEVDQIDDQSNVLYLSCSFVVGRREQPRDEEEEEDEDADVDEILGEEGGAVLAELAVATVGDQIAVALGALDAGLHDEVAGVPFVYRDEDGHSRPGRHRVTQYHDTLHADAETDNTLLWRGLLTAFDELRYDQEIDGGPVWGSGDGRGFRCEVPFGWGPFQVPDDRPVEVVTARETAGSLTSVVRASRQDPHPLAGEGLVISMRTPVHLRPGDDVAGLLAALNRQDVVDPGGAHGVGAWVMHGDQPTWQLFLPNALASTSQLRAQGLLREILLATAGASLLARRLLLTDEDLTRFDRRPVGPASRQPAGLAFAASIAGGDEPALVLDTLYSGLVGPDVEWSVMDDAGFDWWPHHGRQRVRMTPRPVLDGRRAGSLRIATEVATGARATPDLLRLLARRNAEDGRSALVLDPAAGTVEAVARIHVGPMAWTPDRIWARLVAIDQLVRAAEAAVELTRLGGPGHGAVAAASAHPTSGPRPSRDVLFDVLPDIRDRARETLPDGQVRPLVLPVALTALMAPPHRVTGHQPGRALTAEWWTRTFDPSGPAARGRGELVVTDHPELGPGVRARTYLDYLPGDVDERAAWCNDRNRALLAEATADDLTVVGGWGLDATDTPCLTTWFFPETLLGEHPDELSAALGKLLRLQQWIVFVSLADSPVAPLTDTRSAQELAAGLPSLFGAFRAVLDYPSGLTLTARAAGRTSVQAPTGTLAFPEAPASDGTPSSNGACAPEGLVAPVGFPTPGDDAGGEVVVIELVRPYTPPAHEELMSSPRLAQPTSDPDRPHMLTRIDAGLDGLRGPLSLLLTALASGSRTWLPDLSVVVEQGQPGAPPLTVPGHLGNAFRDSHVRDALDRLLFDGLIADDGDGAGFLVLAEPNVSTEPGGPAARQLPGAGDDTGPSGWSAQEDGSGTGPDAGLGFGSEAETDIGLALAGELGLGRRARGAIALLAPPYPIDHPFYGSGVMVLDVHLDPGVTAAAGLARLAQASRAAGGLGDSDLTERQAGDAELAAALTAVGGLPPMATCGAWIAHDKTGTLTYRICVPPACLLWPSPESVGSVVGMAWRIAIAQAHAAARLFTAPLAQPAQ